MGKPSLLDTTLGKKFDIIQTDLVNRLFRKLEEILIYQAEGGKSGSGFSYVPEHFQTEVVQDHQIITDDPPKQIKQYVTVLETSKYIPDDIYSAQVPIPIKAETIITSLNNYLEEVRIINELASLDANDAGYNGAHHDVHHIQVCTSDDSDNICSDYYGDGWNTANVGCKLDSNYGSYYGQGSNGCCGYATGNYSDNSGHWNPDTPATNSNRSDRSNDGDYGDRNDNSNSGGCISDQGCACVRD